MECIVASHGEHLDIQNVCQLVGTYIETKKPNKVLLVPPDITRRVSMVGSITSYVYKKLIAMGSRVDIIPALGSHQAMSEDEFTSMFPDVPYDKMMIHNWREDTVDVGEIPSSFVSGVSEGAWCEPIPVQVNKILFEDYDLILSLGQVVPHEVVGMANYSKNIFVGLGGKAMIDQTHFLSAVHGIQRTLGQVDTPVRAVFDYAHERFLNELPLVFLLTVVDDDGLVGAFLSEDRDGFEAAAELSAKVNVKTIEPVDVVVCYMDPKDYKTTWLANKAVYRTRCAIKDGGTLYVLAPGVHAFGEDSGIDALIRRYGYVDYKTVIQKSKEDTVLRGGLSAAAHLIHGSADGRFRIMYCAKELSEQDIRSVHYDYMDYEEAEELFQGLELGVNIIEGKRVLYTEHAALELWKIK